MSRYQDLRGSSHGYGFCSGSNSLSDNTNRRTSSSLQIIPRILGRFAQSRFRHQGRRGIKIDKTFARHTSKDIAPCSLKVGTLREQGAKLQTDSTSGTTIGLLVRITILISMVPFGKNNYKPYPSGFHNGDAVPVRNWHCPIHAECNLN